MIVKLLHNTPLWVCSTAIRKCWASEGKSDTQALKDQQVDELISRQGVTSCEALTKINASEFTGPKDKELIERIGNKNKHSSTLEHLNYSFDIDGISRACLQELARHRHASLSVKSSRYTLKELKGEAPFISYDTSGKHPVTYYDAARASSYVVLTDKDFVNDQIIENLDTLRVTLDEGFANDVAKYVLPEAYKTSLVWTVNARSLQNFLALRTNKAALKEIQELAHELFNNLPEEHKYLFVDMVQPLD